MSRSNYAYITGLIRALENGLPDYTDLERMVDAPDTQAAFQVLNDTDYAKHLLDVKVDNFYYALHDDWRAFRGMLETSVPDKELLDLLYLREDVNNLKIILKSHFSGASLQEARPTDAGSVSQDAWMSYFENESQLLSDFWRSMIDEVIHEMGEPVSSQLIDSRVDRKYFSIYREKAVNFGNEFIVRLAETEIDVANVKAYVRARRLKRSALWLTEQLAECGTIPKDEIMTWLDLDDTELVKRFHIHLPIMVARELEKGYTNGVTEVVEQALYNWRREYLKNADYVAYGPEVVMKYFYAKVRALINIRMIMMGKINGLSADDIKERIQL